MTKARKWNKLGNAIRRYRGVYIQSSGKWKMPPDPSAVAGIKRWMERLGLQFDNKTMRAIDGFKVPDDMRRWINLQRRKVAT